MVDEIMSAREIAGVIRLHPVVVFSLFKDGKIPGKKFGRGGWKARRDDFMQFLYECGNEKYQEFMKEGGFSPAPQN